MGSVLRTEEQRDATGLQPKRRATAAARLEPATAVRSVGKAKAERRKRPGFGKRERAASTLAACHD